MRSFRYDMRSPVDPSYEDWLEVRVCRTLWGRIEGAAWLLFSNWKKQDHDKRSPRGLRERDPD